MFVCFLPDSQGSAELNPLKYPPGFCAHVSAEFLCIHPTIQDLCVQALRNALGLTGAPSYVCVYVCVNEHTTERNLVRFARGVEFFPYFSPPAFDAKVFGWTRKHTITLPLHSHTFHLSIHIHTLNTHSHFQSHVLSLKESSAPTHPDTHTTTHTLTCTAK